MLRTSRTKKVAKAALQGILAILVIIPTLYAEFWIHEVAHYVATLSLGLLGYSVNAGLDIVEGLMPFPTSTQHSIPLCLPLPQLWFGISPPIPLWLTAFICTSGGLAGFLFILGLLKLFWKERRFIPSLVYFFLLGDSLAYWILETTLGPFYPFFPRLYFDVGTKFTSLASLTGGLIYLRHRGYGLKKRTRHIIYAVTEKEG